MSTIWYHLYVKPKKNDTHELIYKTEIDSQTQKTSLWLLRGKVEGINQEFGVKIYTVLYITNQDLLHSTGNYIQYLITTYRDENVRKRICVCVCV